MTSGQLGGWARVYAAQVADCVPFQLLGSGCGFGPAQLFCFPFRFSVRTGPPRHACGSSWGWRFQASVGGPVDLGWSSVGKTAAFTWGGRRPCGMFMLGGLFLVEGGRRWCFFQVGGGLSVFGNYSSCAQGGSTSCFGPLLRGAIRQEGQRDKPLTSTGWLGGWTLLWQWWSDVATLLF